MPLSFFQLFLFSCFSFSLFLFFFLIYLLILIFSAPRFLFLSSSHPRAATRLSLLRMPASLWPSSTTLPSPLSSWPSSTTMPPSLVPLCGILCGLHQPRHLLHGLAGRCPATVAGAKGCYHEYIKHNGVHIKTFFISRMEFTSHYG
jgi:hypothetical protein